MDLAGLIAHHAYLVTLLITFLASLGVPMPISLALLLAGASARGGQLNIVYLLPSVWLAALCGDTLLYLGGRYSGWWLLAWLCRLTTNPEKCIFNSADYFYRRGPRTLLFARFIPGLGSVAAPLAGSLNMRLSRFFGLDAIGTTLYTSTWILTGSSWPTGSPGWSSPSAPVALATSSESRQRPFKNASKRLTPTDSSSSPTSAAMATTTPACSASRTRSGLSLTASRRSLSPSVSSWRRSARSTSTAPASVRPPASASPTS